MGRIRYQNSHIVSNELYTETNTSCRFISTRTLLRTITGLRKSEQIVRVEYSAPRAYFSSSRKRPPHHVVAHDQTHLAGSTVATTCDECEPVDDVRVVVCVCVCV